MIEIKMPRLSDTMEEGAVSTWRKHPGDSVAVGDILVEIETDKAVMEYEAYQAGTLTQILVPEGENAEIGAPIALLDDGSGPAEDQDRASERNGRTQVPPASPASVASVASVPGQSAGGAARQLASPLVRKLARENQLDLSRVTGSGPGGRIIRADLTAQLNSATAAPAPVSPVPVAPAPAVPVNGSAPDPGTPEADQLRGTRSVPMTQVRRVIARRLSASAREVPHFYVTAAADAQPLTDLRATLNERLTAAGRPKVSVNDLLIRACALALREHPEVNASYAGDGSGVLLVHDRVNIGVAVAAESGLIVPVITDADTKTVTQLGAEAKHLVTLAGQRKLSPAQTAGGTFTISNLGMFGVEQFTAIINQPEAAILAVGATTREPAVVDDPVAGETIAVRYRLRYTLSVDHRVVDGALAARFLATLTGLIESPWLIIA